MTSPASSHPPSPSAPSTLSPTPATGRGSVKPSFLERRTTKGGLVVLLILLLQIPIFFIDRIIGERCGRSHQAVEEIASKWGREQQVLGPVLVIPFERTVEQEQNGQKVVRQVMDAATFLAEEVQMEVQVASEVRHRGIFELPVYRADLDLKGRFQPPNFAALGIEPGRIFWERASLALFLADPRRITSPLTLQWNGEPRAVQPLARERWEGATGIETPIDLQTGTGPLAFSCRLTLQGSKGLFFVPAGQNTRVMVRADWPNPSFQGDWLPTESTVTASGFQALWQITSLGSTMPRQWLGAKHKTSVYGMEQFGVDLILPVDAYRMAERSVKYQLLFLTLTFATLWLMELLTGLRLHLFHYLLVGAGMCLFYLLELSLAEQMGFALAYALAALAIVGLVSCYCLAILHSARRAVLIGGLIMVLYGYLYSLLINQDYALLAGSVGLFAMLAVVMYLTRGIDWFETREEPEAAAQTPTLPLDSV